MVVFQRHQIRSLSKSNLAEKIDFYLFLERPASNVQLIVTSRLKFVTRQLRFTFFLPLDIKNQNKKFVRIRFIYIAKAAQISEGLSWSESKINFFIFKSASLLARGFSRAARCTNASAFDLAPDESGDNKASELGFRTTIMPKL